MKITVCIGSSCHIKGSQQVIEQLQFLLAQSGLEKQVELVGAFCMGDCMNGVNVKIGDTAFSLLAEHVPSFFETEVKRKLVKQTEMA